MPLALFDFDIYVRNTLKTRRQQDGSDAKKLQPHDSRCLRLSKHEQLSTRGKLFHRSDDLSGDRVYPGVCDNTCVNTEAIMQSLQ